VGPLDVHGVATDLVDLSPDARTLVAAQRPSDYRDVPAHVGAGAERGHAANDDHIPGHLAVDARASANHDDIAGDDFLGVDGDVSPEPDACRGMPRPARRGWRSSAPGSPFRF